MNTERLGFESSQWEFLCKIYFLRIVEKAKVNIGMVHFEMKNQSFSQTNKISEGNGCGSFGRTVASATRRPWFESSHRQNFTQNMQLLEKKI